MGKRKHVGPSKEGPAPSKKAAPKQSNEVPASQSKEVVDFAPSKGPAKQNKATQSKKEPAKKSTAKKGTAKQGKEGPPKQAPSPEATSFPFHEFYREVLQRSCQAEWEDFLACIRTPLPVSFVLLGKVEGVAAFHRELQGRWAGQPDAPSPVPWGHPRACALRFNVSADTLRKSERLAGIRAFVNTADGAGVLSRQEEVSMLPPLLLDVQPEHRVLDMCASPGSKTTQIAFMLRQGLLLANDVSFDRCRILSSRLARLRSEHVAVTNHAAQHFPLALSPQQQQQQQPVALSFDRIMCDVPCSGDGTVRKLPSPFISSWTPMNAFRVHRLQLAILTRGLRLLAPRGRLVYSTCSLNPVENEAVVAAVLRRVRCGCFQFSSESGGNNDTVRVVAVRNSLQNFKACPGLRSWRVFDEDSTWYDSFDAVPTNRRPGALSPQTAVARSSSQAAVAKGGTIPDDVMGLESGLAPGEVWPSMFAPKDDDILAALDRCMRIWPHHQNTGGFFIAVFERVPGSAPKPPPCTDAEHSDPPPPALDKKARKKLRAMYPFAARFVSLPLSIAGQLQRELDLSKSFCSNLFVRFDQSQGPCRRVHLMSASLGDLLLQDGGRKLMEHDGKAAPVINFVGAGLCALESSSDGSFHIEQSSATQCAVALPEGKKVRLPPAALISLLQLRSVPLSTIEWGGQSLLQSGRVVVIAQDAVAVCQVHGGHITVCGTVFEQFALLCRLNPKAALDTFFQVTSGS